LKEEIRLLKIKLESEESDGGKTLSALRVIHHERSLLKEENQKLKSKISSINRELNILKASLQAYEEVDIIKQYQSALMEQKSQFKNLKLQLESKTKECDQLSRNQAEQALSFKIQKKESSEFIKKLEEKVVELSFENYHLKEAIQQKDNLIEKHKQEKQQLEIQKNNEILEIEKQKVLQYQDDESGSEEGDDDRDLEILLKEKEQQIKNVFFFSFFFSL